MKFCRKFITWLIVLTLFSAMVTGCNTVEGMGEDVEAGGKEVQDWAD
jgi:predicted small secreted protein